jgi:8-hydroxy-5-deazaflavin:NADPH oxidoreductase
MKTAVIGLGNIGSHVARNLVAGGESIIVAARDLAKAKAFANTLGGEAEAMPIADAVKTADVVILGIWFESIKEFVIAHRASLVGKIVVDPSNPIAPDGEGGFKKIIPADQSSGQIITRLLPEGAELVKAFGTVSAGSLEAAARRKPEPAVLFYATDYPEAGRAVAKLISASGFAPVNVGGVDQSVRLEAFGELSEYGKLGRLVTSKEAEAILHAVCGLQLKSA